MLPRRFFQLLILLVAPLAAQTPAAKPYFTLHRVAPGVYAAIDAPGSSAGSNAGFIVGRRAVAVVDTFESVPAARALLAAIRARTRLPVRYVVNTHYHIDHVTGNQVFADAGAVIFAQRNVRAWIHTQNLKFFPRPTPAQRAWVAGLRSPDAVYAHGVTLYLGGREVDVRVLPGHTGGDSAVLIPDANVVFTGDLFWGHALPNLIDASTAPLLTSLAKLAQWPPRPHAVFVPGHGVIGDRAALLAFRGYVATLRRLVAQARARGLRRQALVAAVLPKLKARYGTWGFFAHFAPLDLLETDAELAGRKSIPRPPAPASGGE
jgi:cyclase